MKSGVTGEMPPRSFTPATRRTRRFDAGALAARLQIVEARPGCEQRGAQV
jgi:hypothetical protein